MALVKATEENVFVGSIVIRGSSKLYVYKVNAKSLYVGIEKESKLLEHYEMIKTKGFTYLNYLKKKGAEKVTYDNLLISSEEVSRKEGFLKLKEEREKTKDWLGKAGKKVIIDLMKREKKTGRNITMFPNEVGSDKIFIIALPENRNGMVLVRFNDAYLFYDTVTEIYTRFKKDIHKSGKTIIFPNRIIIGEEKAAV